MKRFVDYSPTEEEAIKIFGSKRNFVLNLDWFNKKPGCIDEVRSIMFLLILREQRDESHKLLEELLKTVDDERIKRNLLQEYASWFAKDGEIIN